MYRLVLGIRGTQFACSLRNFGTRTPDGWLWYSSSAKEFPTRSVHMVTSKNFGTKKSLVIWDEYNSSQSKTHTLALQLNTISL